MTLIYKDFYILKKPVFAKTDPTHNNLSKLKKLTSKEQYDHIFTQIMNGKYSMATILSNMSEHHTMPTSDIQKMLKKIKADKRDYDVM
ncbi:hypothetical protein COBT_003581, partial [Conglomerata obtusa]